MNPDLLFADLIPCNNFFFPFVDRHAWFGVTFDQGRALGPGMLQLRSTAFTAQPADALLPLWVCESGQWTPVARQRITHLPWCVTEEGTLGSVSVIARHVYLDERTLLCTFSFTNCGDQSQTLTPAWCGLLNGDRFRGKPQLEAGFGIEDHPRRTLWAELLPDGLAGGLRDETGILPQPALRVRAPAGVNASLHRGPCWTHADAEPAIAARELDAIHYRFTPGDLTLAPGEQRLFNFVVDLDVTTFRDAQQQPGLQTRKKHRQKAGGMSAPESYDTDAAVAASRERFLSRIDWTNPPAAPTPALQAKAWRARWALQRTGFQSRPADEFGGSIASTCVPSNSGFTRVFFWDSLFTSVALSDFDPEFARGAIRAVFARQDPESGACPEHSFNFHVQGRSVIGAPQMPVASWAVGRYLRRHPDDEEFLAEIYPRLALNHRYWLRQGDRDGDGLAEPTWTGQCADNSPLYEPYYTGSERGCTWLPPIASVQLNAFLYRDAMELAALADRLGRHGDAAEWRGSAERRAGALLRVCYLPDEHRFWDYDHATRRHRRVRTHTMFWPVWAEMPVPGPVKRDLIENVLLDPLQFFGPIPFPTVAYDERHYDSGGYWRGRSWPHISYWLIEMLAREGYADAAAEAARRTLAAMLRDPAFTENLNTNADHHECGGQLDYNWGCAAVYLLATGAWRNAV